MIVASYLFGIAIIPAQWASAASYLPLEHIQLVRSFSVDRTSSGQSRPDDLSVHLPPYRGDDGVLWHEVGHIVYYSRPEVEHLWLTQYWAKRAVEPPVSHYGATNEREAFAEAYKEYVEHRGHIDQRIQDDFMRRYVFPEGWAGQ